jgi:hypothetical protein
LRVIVVGLKDSGILEFLEAPQFGRPCNSNKNFSENNPVYGKMVLFGNFEGLTP